VQKVLWLERLVAIARTALLLSSVIMDHHRLASGYRSLSLIPWCQLAYNARPQIGNETGDAAYVSFTRSIDWSHYLTRPNVVRQLKTYSKTRFMIKCWQKVCNEQCGNKNPTFLHIDVHKNLISRT